MQVETYEVEDVKTSDATTMANDAAAAELIEKLNLDGQKSLLNKDTLTRVPYAVANEEDLLIFRLLNAESCSVETYSLDPIPVRVLQVLEHAKSLNFFKAFSIWYPRAGRTQDPVLVGIREWIPPGRSWSTTDTYILARWGKMLAPMDQLRIRAIAVARSQMQDALTKMRAEISNAEQIAAKTQNLKWLSYSAHCYLPSA